MAVAWLRIALAFLVGLVLAMFLVFRTLFTDSPGDLWHPELLFAHALTLVGYGAAAWALGRRTPFPPVAVLVTLAAPGLLVIALYREPPIGLRALTGLALLLGLIAATLRLRMERPDAAA